VAPRWNHLRPPRNCSPSVPPKAQQAYRAALLADADGKPKLQPDGSVKGEGYAVSFATSFASSGARAAYELNRGIDRTYSSPWNETVTVYAGGVKIGGLVHSSGGNWESVVNHVEDKFADAFGRIAIKDGETLLAEWDRAAPDKKAEEADKPAKYKALRNTDATGPSFETLETDPKALLALGARYAGVVPGDKITIRDAKATWSLRTGHRRRLPVRGDEEREAGVCAPETDRSTEPDDREPDRGEGRGTGHVRSGRHGPLGPATRTGPRRLVRGEPETLLPLASQKRFKASATDEAAVIRCGEGSPRARGREPVRALRRSCGEGLRLRVLDKGELMPTCCSCLQMRRRAFFFECICDQCNPMIASDAVRAQPPEPHWSLQHVIAYSSDWHHRNRWVTDAEARDKGTASSAKQMADARAVTPVHTFCPPMPFGWLAALAAAPEDQCSDYENSLVLLARLGYVTEETWSLACSIYHAWTLTQRTQRRPQRSRPPSLASSTEPSGSARTWRAYSATSIGASAPARSTLSGAKDS